MPTELADGLGLRDALLFAYSEAKEYAPKIGSPVPASPCLKMAVLVNHWIRLTYSS